MSSSKKLFLDHATKVQAKTESSGHLVEFSRIVQSRAEPNLIIIAGEFRVLDGYRGLAFYCILTEEFIEEMINLRMRSFGLRNNETMVHLVH